MPKLHKTTPKFQLAAVRERQQEIIRRLVLGQDNKEIAADLGITPQMVSMTRNSTICKERIAVMEAQRDATTIDVARHIAEIAPKAAVMLEEIMDNEDNPLATRVRIAEGFLDRAGHGKITKVQGSMTHGHFTSEDIARLKEDAKRAARERGIIIDVTTSTGDAVGGCAGAPVPAPAPQGDGEE